MAIAAPGYSGPWLYRTGTATITVDGVS